MMRMTTRMTTRKKRRKRRKNLKRKKLLRLRPFNSKR